MLNPMDSFKFFLLVVFLGSVSGIMFNIHPNTQKCLRDEMVTRQLIGGEYEITDAPGQKVDILIRDSRGHILYQKEKISQGKFSFSSDVNDYFEVCFISVVPAQVRGVVQDVRLIIKKDIENKNYEAIIEAGNLKPMEVDLQKLEDLSNAIVTDFAAMRKREEQMRDTNESTNNRVLFFSIFGTCCLLGLATWQVLYLRRYFIAKKLI